MPTFHEHAVHFIRARSSLILSCSFESIPYIYIYIYIYIYSLFNGKGEEEREDRVGERERGRKSH